MKKAYSAGAILAAAAVAVLAYLLNPGGDIGHPEGTMAVSFIDVGQGDSELIQLPDGRNILIDTGENSEYDNLKSYLQSKGVERIDHCIATHPHSDHMGSMASIVEDFEIGEFYMPDIINDTVSYNRLLDALDEKGIEPNDVTAGDILLEEEGIRAEFLAPADTEYEDLNNYSAVLRLAYGDTAFLFTGDAETDSEQEMLNAGYELSADVLKVGHHGSRTSSSSAFLDAVNPQYAVISCGKDNDYGHPAAQTIENLEERDITILQTQNEGDIVFLSDGKSVAYQQ